MNFRHFSTTLGLLGLLVATPGCKDFYDVNVDPIRPTTAQVQQLLPVTQAALSTYIGFNIQGLGQPTSAIMQQLSNGRGIAEGGAVFLQTGSSFSAPWNGLYSDMLINNEQIIRQGTEQEQWVFVGIAQIQKAYAFSQMVDMFGSIPYSEALRGVAELNPRFDLDQDIYLGNQSLGIQGLFSLIDEGIANLSRGGGSPSNSDLIYGGRVDNWRKFGNTLKLKLYVQIHKVRTDEHPNGFGPEIQALLANPAGLISSNADDFEFRYGASIQPENRHIGFLSDYVNISRENSVGRQLYIMMRYGTDSVTVNFSPTRAPSAFNIDPRVPYYFFNQRNDAAVEPGIFDYQDPFNGRFVTTSFGSNSPRAASNTSDTRTLPGLYPYGGRYDDGYGGNADFSYARGRVAQRMLPYFSRLYLEAEARLMVLNDQMGAATALEQAIRASFQKVNDIAIAEGTPTSTNAAGRVPANVTLGPVPTIAPAVINSYVTRAMARFNRDPLRTIMTEKYIASFGMGPDIYTDFRRTGLPQIGLPSPLPSEAGFGIFDVGAGVQRAGGAFPRRLFYSQQDLNANSNAPEVQPSPQDRIFWDK